MISLPVHAIAEPERRSLENLLGHPLKTDQQVLVLVYSAGHEVDEATRRAAAERMRSTLAVIDQYRAANSIDDSEVEAAINEAVGHVRPRC